MGLLSSIMTYYEFMAILKTAKVDSKSFFSVHGLPHSSNITWGRRGVVPPWIDKLVLALIEVPGYKGYILNQDLEKIRKGTRNGQPIWLRTKRKHKDRDRADGGPIDLALPNDGSNSGEHGV